MNLSVKERKGKTKRPALRNSCHRHIRNSLTIGCLNKPAPVCHLLFTRFFVFPSESDNSEISALTRCLRIIGVFF